MRELIEAQRARSTGFRETWLLLSPWAHASQVVRVRCFARRQKLKFSSPGGTALSPFQDRQLVLLDPNWFQQSRQEVFWCRRTAASGTTEFQI